MSSPFSFNYKEKEKKPREEPKTKNSSKDDPTKSKSFQIALDSGRFRLDKNKLRPKNDSGIAEKLGHTKGHNPQSYILPANKPEKDAIICGGERYDLQRLAEVLGVSLDEPQKEVKRATPPTRLPKKEKPCERKGGYKQHSRETNISDVEEKYFRYFEEHGIENPKEFLAGLGVYFTTLTTGTYKGKKAFVFKLHNDSFKYFFLDDSFKVIDKRTNKEGSDTSWRDPKHDNGQDLYIFEGFADCLKALQMGYNAFTWSGGVQSLKNLADCFEVKKERSVYICIDSDEAGHKAFSGIFQAFIDKGHNPKAIELNFENEQGKDFCDYMLTHPKEDFEKLIEKALGPEDFQRRAEKAVLERAEDVLKGLSNPCERFDTSVLPDLLKNHVDHICSTTEADPITVTMSLIGTISGFLKKRVYIPEDDYVSEPRKCYFQRLYPNIWSLIVIESGLFKTTGLNKGSSIGIEKVNEINNQVSQFEEELSNIQGKKEHEERKRVLEARIMEAEIENPLLPQRTTAEGLIDMLSKGYSGTIFQSEFGLWLKNLEKSYNNDLKAIFTDYYDVPPLSRTATKTTGVTSVRYPFISIVGVSTIDWIKENVDIHDVSSGFFARFLLFNPPNKGGIPPAMPQRNGRGHRGSEEELKNLLYHSIPEERKYELSPEAYRTFEGMHHALYEAFESQEKENQKLLQPYLKRWSPYVLKLAMILQFVEQPDSNEIGIPALSGAFHIVEYAMKSTLFLFKSELGESEHQKNCRKVLEYIAKRTQKGKKTQWKNITSSRILPGDTKDYQKVIEHLIQSGELEQKAGSSKKLIQFFLSNDQKVE